ncbi:methylmalonyl Co-A mutase-associated GTPase MeaB [Fulvivirga sp. RKSG066]|uniref:methylmalonyl Co-A mutase-associated GTPase MeaB n=1 Tax=Fulvivirga aurantia TaxID=2529383 RepID=UPI0012BBF98F|nr:methylmalonyl Co-A mutase-associated GTPase MeaB [Fulvivirga aurantia]MTI22087.1 methylmalonyl Co-A mutase-associated GTPase MeaB [Fulvivirga aurantia]
MQTKRRKRLSAEEYIDGVLAGNMVILSKAITLIESNLQADMLLAEKVLTGVLPKTGNALRIGITGVPGVGKSTFIESLGTYITNELDEKLAVLAIDPSSQRTSGSILGDKTRMEELSHNPKAYIRPSATGASLGGVANKTRETMLLCEAAGFDVIFIETVGVGQSEVAVKGMVDFFLLLMLSGAGDELQGIKKGIMEMADAIAITKADGENIEPSKKAAIEYKNALHLFPPSDTGWTPKIITCSALTKQGIDNVWELTEKFFAHMTEKQLLEPIRKKQNINWMHETIAYLLKQQFYDRPEVVDQLKTIEKEVGDGRTTPQAAARRLLG